MLWEFITQVIELHYFSALAAVMSLLSEIEDALTLATVVSAPIFLVASVSTVGMLLLQMFGNFWILF